ncbi:MAG: hypothetical protein KDD33_08955 [Bdellovibrionales bacterium]|nr:hypothetical protein [Bdellovibrionales bacterium]
MKKIILVLFIIAGIGTSVFAEEISSLIDEFQKRDEIVFTKDEGRALNFMTGLKYDINNVIKIEFIPPGNQSFVIKNRNGDICLGDMKADLLRCKNEMGITTINYAGDAD